VKLLSISTSTPRGSAAIIDGDRLLASASYSDLHGHAERLFAAIDEALLASGLDRASLEAVACDIGPGSFTGVRVGVASAKGIALALGLRAVGVTSLEALAAAAFGDGRASPHDRVVSLIDAKKGELFLAAFDASLTPLLAPMHLPRAAVPDALRPLAEGGRVVLVGEVTPELSQLDHLDHRPSVDPAPSPELPDAAWIGRVAAPRLTGADVETDAAALEALYVRAPDAKLPLLG
jgi:tRNA threonylcarbamoyladenosine biosynthesis protein TsaB